MRKLYFILLLTFIASACEQPTVLTPGKISHSALPTDVEEDCPENHPDCDLRALTTVEYDAMMFGLTHIWNIDVCNNIKWTLYDKLVAGKIRAWDNNINGDRGDHHRGGTLAGEIHIFGPEATNADLGWLLLHEGAHAYYGITQANDYQASDWANLCWLGD
jgi:hypothetical protein